MDTNGGVGDNWLDLGTQLRGTACAYAAHTGTACRVHHTTPYCTWNITGDILTWGRDIRGFGGPCKNTELACSTFTLQKVLPNGRVEHLKEVIGELCVGIDSCLLFKAQKEPLLSQTKVVNISSIFFFCKTAVSLHARGEVSSTLSRVSYTSAPLPASILCP